MSNSVRNETRSLVEPEDKLEIFSKEFPQKLHDRARESSQELHKLLLSFSSATLAVYFVALTTKGEAGLTPYQTIISLIVLSSMSLAVFSGLFGLFSDMKRNYFRGSALQESDGDKKRELYASHDRWHTWQRRSIKALNVLFLAGVIASVFYIALRILNR